MDTSVTSTTQLYDIFGSMPKMCSIVFKVVINL